MASIQLWSLGCKQNDLIYYNDGDWVESCTAITESFDGELELCHWSAGIEPARAGVSRLPLEDAA